MNNFLFKISGFEVYKPFNLKYNFSYNTNPSIKVGAAGNPKPKVQFFFDGKNEKAVRATLINEQFQQYEFDLKLPQMKGRHCGKTLVYFATSTLQNTSPSVAGSTIVYVHGTIHSYTD